MMRGVSDSRVVGIKGKEARAQARAEALTSVGACSSFDTIRELAWGFSTALCSELSNCSNPHASNKDCKPEA